MTVAEAQVVREVVRELVLLVKVYAEGEWTETHEQIYNTILTTLGSLRGFEQSRHVLAKDRVRTMLEEEGLE